MSLKTKLASKFKYNKPSQGTNGPMVRDSHWYAIGALIGFIMFSLGFNICSNSNDVFATASSITVSISDNTIDLNVAPTGQGTFSKSSTSTIGVSTTNYTGYTLKISGQDGDNPTALVNGSDNTKTLSSIESTITESQFKALDATAYNNMWGYLPSNYCTSDDSSDCNANTSFLPSPTTAGDIIDVTSSANTAGVINEYEITLGARVDTTATLGTYSNVFLVTAIANATPYTITFVDNTVTSMPVDMSGTSDTDTVPIVNTVPQRNGYTFLGWCRGTVTNNSNGTDTCSGTVYNPNGDGTNLNVAIDQTASSNNVILYAMWGGNYTIGALNNTGTMQQLGTMTTENKAKVISTMVTDTNYVLKDSRDNQSYNISKLKDGSVWMTKNLNLAGGTTIDATNSDIPATWTLPTANGFQSGNKLPASSTTGFDDYTKAFVYNSGNTSSSGDTNCGTSGNSGPCYSYYSYIAATAGSGLTVTGNGEDAAWSICPKGWRLPLSGNREITDASNPASYKRSDFYKLATAYGVNLENQCYEDSATFYNNLGPGTNANFLMSGAYNGSTFYNGGVSGFYWSATGGHSVSNALYFYFRTGRVNSADDTIRRLGFSVRCILK